MTTGLQTARSEREGGERWRCQPPGPPSNGRRCLHAFFLPRLSQRASHVSNLYLACLMTCISLVSSPSCSVQFSARWTGLLAILESQPYGLGFPPHACAHVRTCALRTHANCFLLIAISYELLAPQELEALESNEQLAIASLQKAKSFLKSYCYEQ